tara:strand:+ start:223 stop:666 length:444 start_codon:yes stop_codon:yes gene_type:complete
MSKLNAFKKSIVGANGPAQIVSYAFWGVLIAGMLWDFSPASLSRYLLMGWASVSALVLVSCIWFYKDLTQKLLLLDMVISAVVLAIIITHDNEIQRIMYTVKADGHFIKHYVSDIFTIIAVGWMVVHGAYLANLTQRQVLEHKRFTK